MSETQIAKLDWKPGETVQTLARAQEIIDGVIRGTSALVGTDSTPAKLKQALFTVVHSSPGLLQCDVISLVQAMSAACMTDLRLVEGQSWIVPFKGKATLIVGRADLIRLMYLVGWEVVDCGVISDGDRVVQILGQNEQFQITKATFGKHGPCIGAYAYVKRGERMLWSVMTREEIERIRNNAPCPNSPAWRNHFGEMAAKTALRRLSKKALHAVFPDGADISEVAPRLVSEVGETDHLETITVDSSAGAVAALEQIAVQQQTEGIKEQQVQAQTTSNTADAAEDDGAMSALDRKIVELRERIDWCTGGNGDMEAMLAVLKALTSNYKGAHLSSFDKISQQWQVDKALEGIDKATVDGVFDMNALDDIVRLRHKRQELRDEVSKLANGNKNAMAQIFEEWTDNRYRTPNTFNEEQLDDCFRQLAERRSR